MVGVATLEATAVVMDVRRRMEFKQLVRIKHHAPYFHARMTYDAHSVGQMRRLDLVFRTKGSLFSRTLISDHLSRTRYLRSREPTHGRGRGSTPSRSLASSLTFPTTQIRKPISSNSTTEARWLTGCYYSSRLGALPPRNGHKPGLIGSRSWSRGPGCTGGRLLFGDEAPRPPGIFFFLGKMARGLGSGRLRMCGAPTVAWTTHFALCARPNTAQRLLYLLYHTSAGRGGKRRVHLRKCMHNLGVMHGMEHIASQGSTGRASWMRRKI